MSAEARGMALPASGQPLHTRGLIVELFAGELGLLSARGLVLDLRKASLVPMLDELQTAGLIHHMTIDAAVDPRSRVLASLSTAQRAVAVEPSERSRGESCRDPAARLQSLVGRRFDSDFPAALSRSFGGPRGCTHLLTLFHLMASALPRALDFEEAQRGGEGAVRRPGETLFRRSVFLDGTEPGEAGLELSVVLMDYHSAPLSRCSGRLDQLAAQHEVRILASVDLTDLRVVRLEAAERRRSVASLGADWVDIGERVRFAAGLPVMPGFGRAVRGALAGDRDAQPVVDALAQLAPGFVQCTPALLDRVMAAGRLAPGGSGREPAFLAIGGTANSCYMWREEGQLLQIQSRPSG